MPPSASPQTTCHPLAVVDVRVALLDEQAAEHALVVALARRSTARRSRSWRIRIACFCRSGLKRASS